MMRSGEGGLCETADEYFIISPGQFQQPPCGRSHMDILGVRMDSGERGVLNDYVEKYNDNDDKYNDYEVKNTMNLMPMPMQRL